MGGTGTEAIRLATFFIKSDTLSAAHALVDEGVLRQQLWFAPQKRRVAIPCILVWRHAKEPFLMSLLLPTATPITAVTSWKYVVYGDRVAEVAVFLRKKVLSSPQHLFARSVVMADDVDAWLGFTEALADGIVACLFLAVAVVRGHLDVCGRNAGTLVVDFKDVEAVGVESIHVDVLHGAWEDYTEIGLVGKLFSRCGGCVVVYEGALE